MMNAMLLTSPYSSTSQAVAAAVQMSDQSACKYTKDRFESQRNTERHIVVQVSFRLARSELDWCAYCHSGSNQRLSGYPQRNH
eukprot:3426027-Prymnesium_polylepis.1